jgi:lysophospholipase L1-like esterase
VNDSAQTTIFLGDSLTEAGNWAEWFPEVGAVNGGVGGDTSELLLERLDDVVKQAPGTIVLLIGTNDLAWRRPVEQTVRNIESILWKLHHELPETRILVQSVLPRDRELADRVKEINIHVRQFAPTVKAEWVDLWPALAEDDGEIRPEFSEDRLHLTDAGYAAWVETLRPVLTSRP